MLIGQKKDFKSQSSLFVYFDGIECEYSLFLFSKYNWFRKKYLLFKLKML